MTSTWQYWSNRAAHRLRETARFHLEAVPAAACGMAGAAPAEESVVPQLVVAGTDEEPLQSVAFAADVATNTMPPAAARAAEERP